ncbi:MULTISPECIES: MucR family transcriptional regulator, partial [unclassified Methylobacterium]|uniref:MucR family transcriptional regulator n=1 Tax=unclassified Methylobacterium TaxID=2615210 RepID=UPI0005BA95EF
MNQNVETNGTEPVDYIALTSDIVSAYVSKNPVRPADIPGLLSGVHAALAALGQGDAASAPAVEKPTPTQIRKSITHDALISFEDGRPYKTLRRHLTIRDLTPEAYREKWGLPRDYPMTAVGYSEQRSALALSFGLGKQRK